MKHKILTDKAAVLEARELRSVVFDKFHDPLLKSSAELASLIGCRNKDMAFFWGKPIRENFPVPHGVEEHVLRRLRALAGPHGHTYLRILKVRNEAQKEQLHP